MTLVTRMQSTASKLLTKYGQSIAASRTDGTFNPMTGSTVNDEPTTYSGVGYPSNYSKQDIDGDLVRQDDTLLIFYSTTAPQLNDLFTVGSKVMTALSVQLVTLSGSNIIYKIQLRQ